MSKAIILVGAQGCGKTYMTKQLIKPANQDAVIIYDVNGEYSEFSGACNPMYVKMGDFLSKFYNDETSQHVVKNCIGLFEDATSFFSTQGRSEILINMLIARRHTNNTYLFLFHAMQDVPKYILRKCSDLIIFKTHDNPKFVKDNFGYLNIGESWQEVQNLAVKNRFYSSQPPPKGTVPNFKHISLY